MFTPCRVKVRVVACVAAAALCLLLPRLISAQVPPLRALTVTVTDKSGRAILEELAGMSGGRVFYADTERDLNAAFEDLAKELRNQYVIGFAPAAEAKKDGWHEVRVKLVGEFRNNGKKVKPVLRARPGFYDVPSPRRN